MSWEVWEIPEWIELISDTSSTSLLITAGVGITSSGLLRECGVVELVILNTSSDGEIDKFGSDLVDRRSKFMVLFLMGEVSDIIVRLVDIHLD